MHAPICTRPHVRVITRYDGRCDHHAQAWTLRAVGRQHIDVAEQEVMVDEEGEEEWCWEEEFELTADAVILPPIEQVVDWATAHPNPT